MPPKPKAVIAIGVGPEGPPPEASHEPEFQLPSGYELPADSKPGEDIPVLAKIRIKDDGTACLVSLDGATFGGEEREEPEDGERMLDDDTPTDEEEPAPEEETGSLSERLRNLRTKMQR